MGTQVETINIIVREDGSRVVTRSLNDMAKSAGPANKAIGLLKGALAGLVAGAVVNQLREIADGYTQIQNRLRLTTTDQKNLNAVYKELLDISSRTRSSLDANVELYSRLSLSAKNLGVSQKEVLQFTESVNKAIKISGATAAEAEGGLRQLSQGLASGALRGDELNSVLENLPAVADVIAKSLGVTRGQLRAMGADGKITGDIILKAFRDAREELDEKFKTTVPTISEGFVLLKNQLVDTVGQIDAATGASAALGGAFLGLINFLKELTPELVNMTRGLVGNLDPMDEMSTGSKLLASTLVVLLGVLQGITSLLTGAVLIAFKTVGKVVGGVVAAVVAVLQGDFKGAFEIVKSAATDVKDVWVNESNDAAQGAIDATSKMFTKLDQIWNEGARMIQDRSKNALGKVSDVAGPKGPAIIDPKEIEKERKALERLQEQLRSVLNDIAPLQGAQLEMAKDMRVLDAAQQKGLITKQQEAQYVELLKKHYVDILDPLGKYSRDLEQQTQLLSLNTREREIEQQVIQATQELLEKGVILNADEIKSLREKFKAYQDLNAIVQQQDAFLAETVDKRKTFVDQLAALQNLLSDPNSGFTKADATNILSAQNPDLFANTQEMFDAQMQRYQDMYAQIELMRQADLISEQTAAAMRVKVWTMQQEQQLTTASTFFGQLSQLQKSENSKIAAIGKAAAISQAIINTYQSATAAYAAMAGIPYVGPALGSAAAAAAVVAGLANVAQIRNQSTGFATGGSFTVPGTGGVDSQQVAFRATPGERVSVATPSQVRHGTEAGGSEGGDAKPQLNQRIINVMDPKMVGDFLTTPEGEQVLVNVMRRNSDLIRTVVGQS